jgi:hypothetical protein
METEKVKYIPLKFSLAFLYAQGISGGNSLKRQECCSENYPCLFGTVREIHTLILLLPLAF